jgi:hypothetical protein
LRVVFATLFKLQFVLVASSVLADDTTWTFNGDGNWTEVAKWSAGEPINDTFNVIIDDGSTPVVVTLNVSRTIGSLSLGMDDTLKLDTLTSASQTLTSASGFTNDGALLFTSTSSGAAQLAITTGTLTNSATGLLHFQTGGSGIRAFAGDLINNGTVTVDRTTSFNKASGQYTNNSQFTVGGIAALTVSGGGTFEQAAGTLDVNGTLTLSGGSALNLTGGAVNMDGNISLSDGIFTQNGGTLTYTSGAISSGLYRYLGGTITGTPMLTSATLEIGPAATDPVSFLLSNSNSLASDVHAGQTLTVQNNTTSGTHGLTSASGFTNDGSILVTGTSSGTTYLTVTTGTLTNSATGLIHFQVGGGGRTFTGDLANNGTVTVDRATTLNKVSGQYTNNNLFTVNNPLTVSNAGTFNQAAGTLDVNSTFSLTGASALNLNGGALNMDGNIMLSDGIFTQNGGALNYTSGSINSGLYRYLGGTITGTPMLTSATLEIGPAATDPVTFLMSNSNGLASDVHAGQTLSVQNNTTSGTHGLTSASGFTNDGSILVTSTSSGTTFLTLTTGTLTNSPTGLLHYQAGGGSRTFTGDLVNNGTVQVDRSTTFNKAGGMYTNNGQFKVAASQTLTITNGGTLTNLATNTLTGGTYDVSGTFRFPGADIITNQAEIILRGAPSSILNDTGGANALANLATIGTAGAVRLFSGRNFTAAGAFTNEGQLELGGTTFTAPSLANSGIVRASSGGTATLAATTHTNTGTYEALDGSTLSATGGLTNLSGGTLTGGTYRAVDNGGSATMAIPGTAVATLAAGTTAELSGANSTMTFAGTSLASSLINNTGALRILNGRAFAMTNALNNTGTVELGGAALADATLTSGGNITNQSAGTIFGHGAINNTILNSGTVRAANGTLAIVGGIIDGQSGTIQVDTGASLDLSSASGSSDADYLIHNGTILNLGSNHVQVAVDYTNANFGVGNSFNHRANVAGAGQINASPAVSQTLGGNVTNGGMATATVSFGNRHVGDSPTLNYQINNVGASGPSLRGAIQTAAGGGNITDERLDGAGATPGNFGPVAASANSGNLPVTFNATSAGPLTGQQVRIVNNFDNIADQTLQITGAAYRLASPIVNSASPINFGFVHVGDAVSQTISITNDVPDDSYSESLNAVLDPGGSATGGGSFTALAPSATNNTDLAIGINTATAGIKSGSAVIALKSNGTGSSGLGVTILPQQNIMVQAQVNHFAAADVVKQSGDGTLTVTGPDEFTLDLGSIVEGQAALSATLGVKNQPLGGPADTLAGSFTLAAPDFNLSGFASFGGVAAGATQGGLVIALDEMEVGDFTGQITLLPQSTNPQPFSLDLDPITIHIVGQVRLGGDYNFDGFVNAADYTVWRNMLGESVPTGTSADGSGPLGVPDGLITRHDFDHWKSRYGATHGSGAGFDTGTDVPEPAAWLLLFMGLFAGMFDCRQNRGCGHAIKNPRSRCLPQAIDRGRNAGSSLSCKRRESRTLRLRLLEQLLLAEHHVFADHVAAAARLLRQVEHDVEHDSLDDGPQAAGACFAFFGLLGNRLQGRFRELQVGLFH